MQNSKPGLEPRAMIEGAFMAALMVILALAGIYFPIIDFVVMLVWALPAIIVAVRHGMRAAMATIAVATLAIMALISPMVAADIFLRSATPALLIGYGFIRQWKSEKIVFYTAAATTAGMAASLWLSFIVMGVRLRDLYILDPKFVDEVVSMIIESGFMASANTTPEALAAAYVSTFTMIMNVLPGILLAFCLLTAYSNYVLATIIFRKLNLTMPTVTRLTTYRLPIGFIIGFVIGFAIKVLGDIYLSHVPIASLIGLNITIVFLAFYFFQGVGSISYFIEKVPPSLQTILKVMLFLSVLFTYFRLIPVISCIGVADAMLDFRRLEVIPKGKDNEKFEQ